jgi:hypothetical protein
MAFGGSERGSGARRVVLAVLLLSSGTAIAAEPPASLRLDTNARELPQGEVFQLDVVLTLRTQEAVDELALPDLDAFTIVREHRAASTRIGSAAGVGGGRRSVVVEQRFVYALRADRAGTFKIDGAEARIGSFVARAAPVTVRVVSRGGANATAANPPNASPSGGSPAATGASGVSVDRFGSSPPPAFLDVTADVTTVYVGQPLIVTGEVYTQQALGQWPRLPGVRPPGFACTNLLDDQRPQPSLRTVAGKPYTVYLVTSDALFPLQPGDLTIPATSVTVQPAGAFFQQPKPLVAKSQPLRVKVLPLPESGRPSGFVEGNVGQFRLEATVQPARVEAGQPFTLRLAAVGRGNLDQLRLPSWDGRESTAPASSRGAGQAGENARVFPPTRRVERSADDPLAGRVVAEMLVQARREGTLRVPSFSLALFDPEAKAYVEARSEPIIVTVTAARGAVGVAGPSAARPGHHTLTAGTRPTKVRVRADPAVSDAPVALGSGVALFGAGAWLAGAAWQRRRASVAGRATMRHASLVRRVRDATARGDLAALEAAVLDALASTCGADVKAKDTAVLLPSLAARGVFDGLAAEVLAFIRDVETARFAPGGGYRGRLAGAAAELVEALHLLEGRQGRRA